MSRRRDRWGVASVLLLSTLAGAQDEGRFERVLYVHGRAPGEPLYRAAAAAGFTAVSTRGGAAEVARIRAAGLGWYRDQLLGKGELELRADEFRACLERYAEERGEGGLVRPACLADPEVRAGMLARLERALGDTAATEAAIGLCLADEPSATRHVRPLDFCFGPHCLARFRAGLGDAYPSLDALGVAWGSAYASWDAVRPWTADRARERASSADELPARLTAWNDHLAMRDALFAEVVGELVAKSRAVAPGVPVGVTGMQPPSAYGGYDYARLLGSMDFLEVYDIGGARDLARSLARPGAREFATLFPPGEGEPESLVEARLFDMVAHGLAGVIVWSAGTTLDVELVPTPFGAHVADAFRRLGKAADMFARAAMRYDPIWIVESQRSVRVHWMLDTASDGATWVRRGSSYEAEHSTSQASRESWLRLLQDVGYQPRFVAAERLAEAFAAGRPRLLVLPATVALGDDVVAAVRDFVERGGCVVADFAPGRYDAALVRRETGALDDVFGVSRRDDAAAPFAVREGRGVGERTDAGLAVVEPGIEASIAEPVGGGRLVHCEHTFGRGRAVYLNLAVCEYRRDRVRAERIAAARDLRARVRRVVEADAGLAPRVVVRASGMPHLLEAVRLRSLDERALLAIRVNTLEPALLAQLVERGARDVTFAFPSPVRVRCLRTGEDLGVDRQFTRSLRPAQALLFEVATVDPEGG